MMSTSLLLFAVLLVRSRPFLSQRLGTVDHDWCLEQSNHLALRTQTPFFQTIWATASAAQEPWLDSPAKQKPRGCPTTVLLANDFLTVRLEHDPLERTTCLASRGLSVRHLPGMQCTCLFKDSMTQTLVKRGT